MDTNSGKPITRRLALLGGAAAMISAGRPVNLDSNARRLVQPGRIANVGHRHGHRVLSGLFFGGPPNPFTRDVLYSRHPLNEDRLDWSDRSDIDFAVDQFRSAGLNTMKLSYFGHRGETDAYAPALLFSRNRWDGSGGTYTEAEQVALARQLFDSARERDVLIAPMLEVSLTGLRFWEEFPSHPSSFGLVERAVWLLTNFGGQSNYLTLADKNGCARHVIWLIESIHGEWIDPVEFAAGFDHAADLIKQQTGYDVGWVVDPTPNPGYGSHFGPDRIALRNTASVVAINPFNITSQDLGAPKKQISIVEEDRLAYARSIMAHWASSGIPFFAPVLPYFNDTKLFFRDDTVEYGGNNGWRTAQRALALEFATHGLSVDTWNGYSEGYCIPPTIEDGPTARLWLRDITFRLSRRWGQ